MELQFHNRVFRCLKPILRQVQNQEQTQELKLTDGMPDIGRVLGAWGQVLLRSKQWQSGTVSISGGVMAWVMYEPEDGGRPQSVECWIPFQMRWDLPDTIGDGKLMIQCLLRNIDARNTSARKLMLRAGIGCAVQALTDEECSSYEPEDVPADVQLLRKSYPVLLPVEAGEKAFELQEELTLPAAERKPERLIRYELRPEIVDRKVMADKVVFRGAALLHALCRGEDGRYFAVEQEIPFSQFAQLDQEYDQDAYVQVLPVVTGLELEIDPEGRLLLKAGMTGQYVIHHRRLLNVVEDAYSPRRKVAVQKQSEELPMVLDEQSQLIRAELPLQLDGTQVVDLSFWPDHPQVQQNESGVQMELPGMFQILYYDPEGQLQGQTVRWQGTWGMSMGEAARAEAVIHLSGKPQASLSELRADILLDTQISARQGMEMVSGLVLGEMQQADEERPSLILRRVGGDSLWELAKRTGSTVEAICEANRLTDDPGPERLLLIPVS